MTLTFDLQSLFTNGLIKISPNHDIIALKIARADTNPARANLDALHFATAITCNGANPCPSDWLMMTVGNGEIIANYDEVNIGDDAYAFGYPSSLGLTNSPQFDYKRPLLRRGIIAQKYKAARTIIIDAPAYFGNSGGPVTISTARENGSSSIKVIGIVTQFIPYFDAWRSQRMPEISHVEVSNSGYSVVEPIDQILELIRQ